jgi:hypothetical protein
MPRRYHKSILAGSPPEVNLPFNWPDEWRTVRASCAGLRTSSVYLVGGDGSARLFGKSGRDRLRRGRLFGAE